MAVYDNSQSPVTSTTTRYYYDGQRMVVKTLVNTAGSEGDTWSFDLSRRLLLLLCA